MAVTVLARSAAAPGERRSGPPRILARVRRVAVVAALVALVPPRATTSSVAQSVQRRQPSRGRLWTDAERWSSRQRISDPMGLVDLRFGGRGDEADS
jgi:hypothetical protein